MAGIYVHIPFCKSRCVYCGFYSTTFHDVQGRYVDALVRELEVRREYLKEPIRTIYIGGGTPSVLSHDNMKRLCTALTDFAHAHNRKWEGEASEIGIEEFTMECNPDDVNRNLAELIVECGINRVSMGVQSFSDNRLRFLRRRHNADTTLFAVRALRAAGIGNISIDLMFGFPGQTLDEWEHDISKAIRLDVEHVSAYSLMYEEGTPLYKLLEEGKIREIDEETSRAMFEHLTRRIPAADYEHYEISNFARPGFRSIHNSNYWKAVPYLGIGASAHSYDGDSRQWNVCDVFGYMTAILEGEGSACEDMEIINDVTRYNDLITTAMRTSDGINLEDMTKGLRIKESLRDYLINASLPFVKQGLIAIDDNRLHLTHDGIFVSDSIMAELVVVED